MFNEVENSKQVIVIGESYGDAVMHWDTRSLVDTLALLKSAEEYISNQIEKCRSDEHLRETRYHGGSSGSGRYDDYQIMKSRIPV